MTGLEKMKSQILDEAKATADSKIQEPKTRQKRSWIRPHRKRQKLQTASPRNQRQKLQIIRSGWHLPLTLRKEQKS